jgi:hypothetical protein
MKYKRIIDDGGYLENLLRKVNVAGVARVAEMSKTYLYRVMKGEILLSEEVYLKVKKIAEEFFNNLLKD